MVVGAFVVANNGVRIAGQEKIRIDALAGVRWTQTEGYGCREESKERKGGLMTMMMMMAVVVGKVKVHSVEGRSCGQRQLSWVVA